MTVAAEKHLFANLEDVAAHAVEIRHDLHRHPELGYQEIYTCESICKELQRLGIEFTRGLAGGTGVVALLQGTQLPRSGGCVALRADMDALPIQEESTHAYVSQRPGLM